MGFAAVTRSASQGSCISIPSGASPSQPAAGFANLTLLAISFHHHPAPKLGSPCSCGGSRCCPAPRPRGGNCWQQGWGEAAGQPEARVAFLGGDKGRLCLHATAWTNAGHGSCHPRKIQTQQSLCPDLTLAQMVRLVLLQQSSIHYRAPGDEEGSTQLSVQPSLPKGDARGCWQGQGGPAGGQRSHQAVPSLTQVLAKGMVRNAGALKANGSQPLLRDAPLLHPLPGGGTLGHAWPYPCQVSHPLAGDMSAPLRDRTAAPLSHSPGRGELSPPSSPAGSQAAGSGSC